MVCVTGSWTGSPAQLPVFRNNSDPHPFILLPRGMGEISAIE